MANRRMFSLDVIDTDRFLEMPITAQALYYHLGMRADDDGFVSSPRRIIKLVGCNDDDLRVLISKKFIIPFNSGVVVISDWKLNNYLRADRYKETMYLEEKKELVELNGVYQLSTGGIPEVSKRETQVRLGKDSIDKGSIDNGNICPELEEPAPDPSGIRLPLNDKTSYDVPLSKMDVWSAAYPVVDVRQELLKMISWLEANPTKKKTRKGIERFINAWLSREQDKGGRYRNGDKQQNEPYKKEYGGFKI